MHVLADFSNKIRTVRIPIHILVHHRCFIVLCVKWLHICHWEQWVQFKAAKKGFRNPGPLGLRH